MAAGGRIRHVPALDGIRALAVVAVVAFHAQIRCAAGGFLGVSVFFTLSGFLITSLLIAEHESTGRISIREFAGRRARRLLPAAWLCIGLVLLATPLWSPAQRARLTGDALGALGHVANWRAGFATRSYQELFEQQPSPLAHFWSLAIEEQFYVILPTLALVTLRFGRRWFAAAVGVLLVASLGAMVVTDDFDLAYNATHTRAAEMLVGVALALALPHLGTPSVRPAIGRGCGAAGLVGLVALVMTAHIDDGWITAGGLPLVALLSALLIVGAHAPGRLTSVLSHRSLGAIGAVSYGIYLFHWPVFVALTPERTSLDGPLLLLLRLGVVAVITMASSQLLEQPIRRGTRLGLPTRAAAVACCAVASLAIASVAIAPRSTSSTDRLLALGDDAVVRFDDVAAVEPARPTSDTGAPVTAASPRAVTPTTTLPPRVPHILVIGSDTTVPGTIRRTDDVDGLAPTAEWDVVDATRPDCPIARGREVLLDGETTVDVAACEPTSDIAARALAELVDPPDLVIVATGPIDGGIVRHADDAGFPDPRDLTAMDTRLRSADDEVTALTLVLGASGAPVILSTRATSGRILSVLARIDIQHEEVRGVATTDDQLVSLVHDSLVSTPIDGTGTAVIATTVRTLVLGDSTSLFVARALHDASDRIDVLWAGANGCPLVRADAIVAARDAAPTPLDCADFATKLPPIITGFEPDVIILVAGPTELPALTFDGDPTPRIPGDANWIAFHDAEFDALVEVIADAVGTHMPQILIANSPPIRSGQFSTDEMARPERVAAWNDQVDRWIATHSDVTLFDLAGPVDAYEAANGSIRPDGIHADVARLTEIARASFVDRVIEAAGLSAPIDR